ncbi:hypothetical protein EYW49_17275 [Siculibacillus lacustris]|uniref:Nitrous-oxide reductase n=1 Tax=Siculibacillus lacustris TaxID=1549641 RepID=A0A4Q9VIC1_9HYPH|nr:hypothetical protein [Siculibacillus lacustris]TBW34851.1 hypothetical protein EYW49_17275 [Siculibacillus lacustris]
MSHDRHFTTRRGFVGAMGFGALGLYVTWAAYGASPLPFASGGDAAADPHGGHAVDPHAGHGAAAPADPAIADTHGGSAVTPETFERRHADFMKRFRQADGSVRPAIAAAAEHDHGAVAAPATMPAGHDHGAAAEAPAAMPGHDHGAAVSAPPATETGGHAGHGMAMPMPAAPDAHAGHGAGPAVALPPLAPLAVSTPAAAAHADGEPIEVFLAAGRFAFEPDDLRLEVGRAYRFHMMASDVAHGASIAFGRASRIVRLRPDTVTTLDLTFREAGRHLVYCTVYCGPGHDGMHASITVA